MRVSKAYNPWDVLSGGGVDFADSLKGIGADWYTVCVYVGVIGLVISMVIIGIQFALAKGKNSKKWAEAKDKLMTKAILAFLIPMVPFLVGMVVSIAKMIGS